MEITDAEFWKIVSDINWADKKKDQEHTKEKLALLWGPEKSEAVHTKASSFTSALYRAIEHWEREEDGHVDASDDGMSDLTNHIVGLGEEEFNRVMKTPQLAAERASRCDYRESFGYLIPSKFTFEHHLAKLPGRETELMEQSAEVRKNFPDVAPLLDEVDEMIRMAGNLPMTCDEIRTRFREISGAAALKNHKDSLGFLTGWGWVNYITDMQDWGNARRELASDPKI
jgi:hypothetical protein